MRRALHAAGLRFRLQRRDLPGRPDMVLPALRTAVFVHGCFWHGHNCPKGTRRPQSNAEFWAAKLDRNTERDRDVQAALEEAGWAVRIVWECELDYAVPALVGDLTRLRYERRG